LTDLAENQNGVEQVDLEPHSDIQPRQQLVTLPSKLSLWSQSGQRSHKSAKNIHSLDSAVDVAAAADRCLLVKILSAHGLRNTDFVIGQGCADPYCIVEVPGKGDTRCQTHVVMNDLNPVWNFETEIVGWDVADPLVFTVMVKDPNLKSDDFLGQVTLDSNRFFPDGLKTELQLDGGHAAYVSVEVVFHEDGREYFADILKLNDNTISDDVDAYSTCSHWRGHRMLCTYG